MWYLVFRVYNVLNLIVFRFKIRKVQMPNGSYWSLRRTQGHRCLSYRRDLFSWRLDQTTWYYIIVRPTRTFTSHNEKKKKGLFEPDDRFFTKLHVNTAQSEHTLACAL